MTTPEALHAFYLTILIAAISVTANTIFGIACALLLVRTEFRGKALLNAAIDLPFAISPVVIGLSLYLLYGREGWFGGWLLDSGFQILFSLPGMVLATIFVSLPFVVREVVPVLHEIGDEQEQAAQTLGAKWWQTFRRITLPAIRWGVAYGVVESTYVALDSVCVDGPLLAVRDPRLDNGVRVSAETFRAQAAAATAGADIAPPNPPLAAATAMTPARQVALHYPVRVLKVIPRAPNPERIYLFEKLWPVPICPSR